jgi:hypothetical protein
MTQMNEKKYRLTVADLLSILETWDRSLSGPVLIVACGGTALSLNGYKDSTKDADFLVPLTKDYETLLSLLKKKNYQQSSGNGWISAENLWIFQLYKGNQFFVTEFLDPVHLEGNHKVIQKFKRLTLACLNAEDLIISKMFRGDQVDVDDCIAIIKKENLCLESLGSRYKETAG